MGMLFGSSSGRCSGFLNVTRTEGTTSLQNEQMGRGSEAGAKNKGQQAGGLPGGQPKASTTRLAAC